MSKFRLLLALNLLCFAFIGWFYMQPADPPYVAVGQDSVIPVKVRAGDSVEIFRTFRIMRKQSIYIVRTMAHGDCTQTCEVMDLPSGYINLKPGEYVAIGRRQTVPLNTAPGFWVISFTAQWEDKLGRTFSVKLPELTIEVLP